MSAISKYKHLLTSFLVLLITIFGVTIVFGSNLVFDIKVSKQTLSKNIFYDYKKLNDSLVAFTSTSDLSKFRLESNCSYKSKFLGYKENTYYYSIYFRDVCDKVNVYLSDNGDIIPGTNSRFKIYRESDLFSIFSDLSDKDLSTIESGFKLFNREFSKLKSSDKISYLSKLRESKENDYKIKLIDRIQEARTKKYLVPVDGFKLPTLPHKVPNARRPYRENYTDGIHHSWDIDTKLGEEVISLDESVVVKIVDNWEWADFSRLKYGKLTYEQELNNLDILRGNQIWLKTSKGDVVFYAHLDKVYENVKVGSIVARGQKLGTIGTSGVPDKKYNDYHLDYAIHKNPHVAKNAGKYTLMDYMKWDWYFKGSSYDEIIRRQYEVFSK